MKTYCRTRFAAIAVGVLLVLLTSELAIVMSEFLTPAVSGVFCHCLVVALDDVRNQSKVGGDRKEDCHNCFRLWTTP